MKANKIKTNNTDNIIGRVYIYKESTHSNSGIHHRQMRERLNKQKITRKKRSYLNVTR